MENKIIIYQDELGLCILYPILDCGLSVDEIALKDVPKGKVYNIVDSSILPNTFKFKAGWKTDEKLSKVTVDLGVAKDVAHTLRRVQRSLLLIPLDNQVNFNIANSEALAVIEEKREAIRKADALLQINIDNASTVEELDKLTTFA